MALTYSQQSARAADAAFRAIVDAVIARELPVLIGEPVLTEHYAKRNALALDLVRPGGLAQYREIFYALMASQTRGEVDGGGVPLAVTAITDGAYSAAFGVVFLVVAGVTAAD
jgi:hypothetical protein